MVAWYWIPVALIVGAVFGAILAAIVSANRLD